MLYQTGTDMIDMFIKDSTDYAWYKGQIQGPYRTDARTFKDLTGLNQGPSRILSERFKDFSGVEKLGKIQILSGPVEPQ